MNRQDHDERRLPDGWTGEVDELVAFEDALSGHDTPDRIFTDRAEGQAAAASG